MLKRKRLLIEWVVQGVWFRPTVYGIAKKYNLCWWVCNYNWSVEIEVEWDANTVENFEVILEDSKPQQSNINKIVILSEVIIDQLHYQTFDILHSKMSLHSINTKMISPDLGICDDCIIELSNPQNRRYMYPFTNCTNCWPRYSIIKQLPYDRINTTMNCFTMCKLCKNEYDDPSNRRFHAQATCCPDCWPKLCMLDANWVEVATDDIILDIVNKLKQWEIIALKWIWWFHILADPTNNDTITKLRARKKRRYKPFAMMSAKITDIEEYCTVSLYEKDLLNSSQKPIVLLQKKKNNLIDDIVAPWMNTYWVMLAYTPLHYLIIQNNFKSLLVTSGNLSWNPIIYENGKAIEQLGQIADYMVLHNRDIEMSADDSILMPYTINGVNNRLMIRRWRWHSPSVIAHNSKSSVWIALWSDFKNSICTNDHVNYILSQYIWDIDNEQSYSHFEKAIDHISKLYQIKPAFFACDLNPSFLNKKYVAHIRDIPVIQVQHHHAHLVSWIVDQWVTQKVIGVIYDWLWYGDDGNYWWWEFLVGDYDGFERVWHYQNIKLLGWDKATKEPYRILLSLLFDIFWKDMEIISKFSLPKLDDFQIDLLQKMHELGINVFLSSSVGRLFDAVSSLLWIRYYVEYEWQAAIELEQITDMSHNLTEVLDYEITTIWWKYEVNTLKIFWSLVELVLNWKHNSWYMSRIFHNTICAITKDMCIKIRQDTNIDKVVLSGWVFQNRILLEQIIKELTNHWFEALVAKYVPVNDWWLSLWQLAIASHRYNKLQ